MRRTIYLSDDADKVLDKKKNKSGYISSLILADTKQRVNQSRELEILALISTILSKKLLELNNDNDREYAIKLLMYVKELTTI